MRAVRGLEGNFPGGAGPFGHFGHFSVSLSKPGAPDTSFLPLRGLNPGFPVRITRMGFPAISSSQGAREDRFVGFRNGADNCLEMSAQSRGTA